MYRQSWGAHWSALLADMLDQETPAASLAVGTGHSVSVNSRGQIFVWGSNERGQCARVDGDFVPYSKGGRVVLPGAETRVRQVVSGSEHCLALDHAGNVYVWGGNHKGQLGTG